MSRHAMQLAQPLLHRLVNIAQRNPAVQYGANDAARGELVEALDDNTLRQATDWGAQYLTQLQGRPGIRGRRVVHTDKTLSNFQVTV